MKHEALEVVRGSGNVFRDLGHENADVAQLKAILAVEIVRALDRERLTVRAAESRTGIAAADFSRIRNADLGRFTVDRLMSIINRFGARVDVKIKSAPAQARGLTITNPFNRQSTIVNHKSPIANDLTSPLPGDIFSPGRG
jgi:predicted XRE-type DNA-binding protein